MEQAANSPCYGNPKPTQKQILHRSSRPNKRGNGNARGDESHCNWKPPGVFDERLGNKSTQK